MKNTSNWICFWVGKNTVSGWQRIISKHDFAILLRKYIPKLTMLWIVLKFRKCICFEDYMMGQDNFSHYCIKVCMLCHRWFRNIIYHLYLQKSELHQQKHRSPKRDGWKGVVYQNTVLMVSPVNESGVGFFCLLCCSFWFGLGFFPKKWNQYSPLTCACGKSSILQGAKSYN